MEHHIEEGQVATRRHGRRDQQVEGPVIAIALILAAVFIPVAFMGGITGVCTSSSR